MNRKVITNRQSLTFSASSLVARSRHDGLRRHRLTWWRAKEEEEVTS
jgi:hypothetical protein